VSGAVAGRLERVRRIGILVIAEKVRFRAWSTRVAVVVSSSTEPRPSTPARLPLTFAVVPSETIDAREFDLPVRRSADVLYIEGMLRMYRLAPGDAMVARTTDGKLAGVGLMSYADRHDRLEVAAAGLYYRLPPHECWTEAHYVLPEFRNQGVIAAVLAAERDHLRARGVRTAMAVIHSGNARSLHAFARAGYTPTGVVRLDRYRFGRFATRFTRMDERTREQWRQAAG
jgi:RimJ/RimL family protein N-acetyltransferase